jgi:5-deoxy-glucuronate isomerase
MPTLLVRPSHPDADGRILSITPENAGWRHVGFAVHRLASGQTIAGSTADRETCLVLLSGKALIRVDDVDFGVVGGRATPFEGPAASVYAPAAARWRLTADGQADVAVCTAPGRPGSHPARLIGPDQVVQTVRGTGSNTRHVRDILPETAAADSLLVVEVITPGGNWSSYPPHKHDRDALPEESNLEETYYHRLNPPQGFAFQRVYTDDRSIDETMAVEDGCVVKVPRGYHPVGAPHGYDLYYLNVMAGPKRVWRFHNDPAHAWMLSH